MTLLHYYSLGVSTITPRALVKSLILILNSQFKTKNKTQVFRGARCTAIECFLVHITTMITILIIILLYYYALTSLGSGHYEMMSVCLSQTST